MSLVIRIIFLFSSLLYFPRLLAQSLHFRVEVSSKTLTLQDYLQVRYVVEGSRETIAFPTPAFNGFRLIEGPEQVTGWNMFNDEVKEYTSVSFLLKPERAGTLLIPSLSVTINRKSYTSNALSVKVSSAPVESPEDGGDLFIRSEEEADERIARNLFVRLEVNKQSCYVGEPVVATYKLYTRLRSESRVISRPSLNGFSVYDMVDPESGQVQNEMVNGRAYAVYLLRKVQLYPLQEGDFRLDPMEVENEVTFLREDKLGGPVGLTNALRYLAEGKEMDAVFKRKLTLRNAPVTIRVKALPIVADADFNGAVGSFALDVQVADQDNIHAHDLAELVIRIAGKGNFPVIPIPAIHWPDSVRSYDETVKEHYTKFVSPISGYKIFTIPFMVSRPGILQLPVIRFTYYDAEAQLFRTLQSAPLKVSIKPAKKTPDTTRQDITQTDSYLFALLMLLLAIMILAAGWLLWRKKKITVAQRNPGLFVNQETLPADVSLPGLEELMKAMKDADAKIFYRELGNWLDAYLVRIWKVEPQADWQQELVKKGAPEVLIQEISALKQRISLMIYTPFVDPSFMETDLERIKVWPLT